MENDTSDEQASEASMREEKVGFQQVVAVASEWMSDFMFLKLCRSFRDGNLEEFNEALPVFEAISKNLTLKGAPDSEKKLICAFLSRVMHGKQLDDMFEDDEHVKPLMSAFKIWQNLDQIVADENLFEKINILLLVQSVAVCLEAGQRSSASSALKWLEEHHNIPQNLRVKLSTMVTQRDIYHPFLMSFSFSRLVEMIQSFLDVYLEKNPSDFLLKAATKMVQSSRIFPCSEHAGSQDDSLSETDESVPEIQKTKRKLLPTQNTDVWKLDPIKKPVTKLPKNESSRKRKLLPTKIEEWSPEIIKKPQVSLTRLTKTELCQMKTQKPLMPSNKGKTRKAPQKIKVNEVIIFGSLPYAEMDSPAGQVSNRRC
ncbi:telomeric repeat-binding factor 1 isoform X2 [Oryzias melastigma]|uniref:Telomeric repeat binding factor (NIMA-interacting) 1 n=1 Tax=Oryzias melastigma TaxID=30732 RepID=A0A3B3DDX0_ORYME|nr:telomeric repeat-binding factor 1 isoform X2 [Oryzias melastigma]